MFNTHIKYNFMLLRHAFYFQITSAGFLGAVRT